MNEYISTENFIFYEIYLIRPPNIVYSEIIRMYFTDIFQQYTANYVTKFLIKVEIMKRNVN